MEYKKNQVVKVSIEDMSDNGEGIGKINGYTLFVKDAVIGDTIEAVITKVKKNYGYAKLKSLISESDKRCIPECEFSRQCGGCQIQEMSYLGQLEFKQNKVANHLIRIGGFAKELIDTIMEPIVGMEVPWHYRNKAQYPIGCDKDGKVIAGFYAQRTHDIIANTDCLLGVNENKVILETIIKHMERYSIKPYDEKTGEGLVRHVLIRKGFETGEIMVCIIVNLHCRKKELIPHVDELVCNLSAIEGMTSVSINLNPKKTNVIMGDETVTIYGSDSIVDRIYNIERTKGYDFTISPRSFFQVNPFQTGKLYSLAVEFAGLTGKETVWDLYCGAGTISLFMADKASKVYGVEIIPEAIADARRNATNNNISNVEFYVGSAEEIAESLPIPDVIVVDPPRKGCDTMLIDTILKVKPERVVYVSCDSSTLSRDLKLLCEEVYALKRVRVVDQFAHSVHVETVVLMSRKEK